MKTCFSSPMIITQNFGNDFLHKGKWYYKSLGIDGHDGIDVIPEDETDLSVLNILPGIIKILKNHPIYGNRIAIWSPELNLTEYHNHLEYFSNEIHMNMEIKSGTYLGMMGESGRCFGKHDHLAYARTNSRADRINRGNGYFGYIDPIPFLAHNIH